MNFKPLGRSPEVVYHYTKLDNVSSITKDKEVKRFKDTYTFFTESLELADWLLKNVTCNPNCGTVGFDGIIRKNDNNIKDYCILKLTVNKNYIDNTKWYLSDSAFNGDKDVIDVVNSSICYKGNLKFVECEVVKFY